MRALLDRIATRFRAYRMARALDRGHLLLAQLRRMPVKSVDDLVLRCELATAIEQGELVLMRMKVRA